MHPIACLGARRHVSVINRIEKTSQLRFIQATVCPNAAANTGFHDFHIFTNSTRRFFALP
jgi:hypothetical protein